MAFSPTRRLMLMPFRHEMLKVLFTYKKVYAFLAHIKNYMYLCIVIINKMFNP